MLTMTLSCRNCGAEHDVSIAHFQAMGFAHLPKFCPACNDRRQARPSVALKRETLAEMLVTIGKTAAALFQSGGFGSVGLQEFLPDPERGDKACWKMTLTGGKYGVCWSGRYDVYSHVAPELLVASARVLLNYTRVEKEVWMAEELRQTLQHGIVRVRRRVSPDTEGAVREVQEDTYVCLLPGQDLPLEPEGTLVWAKAYSKYTFKGYGRQQRETIDGVPIWYLPIEGGVRSGRASTVYWLAVQTPDMPLSILHCEGGGTERYLVEGPAAPVETGLPALDVGPAPEDIAEPEPCGDVD